MFCNLKYALASSFWRLKVFRIFGLTNSYLPLIFRNKWKETLTERFGDGKKCTQEEELFHELKILKEEEPDSTVVIHFDPDTNFIQSVFVQFSGMKEDFEKYPEVLVMDTTYKLCENKMPLIVFDVVDCFGRGRVVGYALIISEKKEIVTGALEVLKMGCEKTADKVETVVIDKDQSEIASIREILPNAEVHLCDYHVKEAIKRSGASKLTDNWPVVKTIIHKLIHAFTEEAYDKAYAELEELVGKDSKFMVYFNKFWHNSELVWTEYKRNMTFTVGERTTGRVECHNKNIKIIIDRATTAGKVIKGLRLLHKGINNENEHRLFLSLAKTQYHKYSKDPIIQQIMKINTPFIGDLLKSQYERSLEPPSSNAHNVTFDKCDCVFFIKYKLICSHIFRERRLKGKCALLSSCVLNAK